jgi:hypothetical protein
VRDGRFPGSLFHAQQFLQIPFILIDGGQQDPGGHLPGAVLAGDAVDGLGIELPDFGGYEGGVGEDAGEGGGEVGGDKLGGVEVVLVVVWVVFGEIGVELWLCFGLRRISSKVLCSQD